MIDISEVRRRLVHAIDRARRAADARRASVDDAEREYEAFRVAVAVPVFRMMATALRGEGLPFTLSTPSGRVRLQAERSSKDFVELELDTDRLPPVVVGRIGHMRGGHVHIGEKTLREDVSIRDLTDEDVLRFLIAEIEPLV